MSFNLRLEELLLSGSFSSRNETRFSGGALVFLDIEFEVIDDSLPLLPGTGGNPS